MQTNNRYRTTENIVYLIVWLIVFIFPIILSSRDGIIDWNKVQHEWVRFSQYFIIFLINNYLLFKYFNKKNYLKYFTLIFLTILAISFLGVFKNLLFEVNDIPRPNRPHGGGGPRGGFPGGPQPGGPPPRGDQPRSLNPMVNNIFYSFFISILVVGLNNAVKIAISWAKDRRNFELLQQENLKNELALLRHQISPHFFMNTLNNIHALIDYDKDIAKNSVVKLSKLMRVLLYESNNDGFTLKKEISFIGDYIELMRIRVNENVKIEFTYPDEIPLVKIPPLLFISYVENAFKHGIKAMGESFIHIDLQIEDNYLITKIENSKANSIEIVEQVDRIGLSNSQKRLDLLYKDNHEFNIHETDATYEVNIKIPLL